MFWMLATVAGCGSTDDSSPPESSLDEVLEALVADPNGPPGAVVVVERGGAVEVYTAGVSDLATGTPVTVDDHMRMASVAKAFSGAAALALVAEGTLTLDDTVGERRPDLPASWASVTLRQLLNHTSGIDDFSLEESFRRALVTSLTVPPLPIELLSYLDGAPPSFPPGSRYRYSNSDNIIVGLMIEAATGERYEDVLATRVYGPLALASTSLPAGPDIEPPFLHGYDVDPPFTQDVSELFAAGWTWASGGIVSTPADATGFVRGYVGGALFDAETRSAQFRFVEGGGSEPPGPGANAAGLALFRYQTRCGTVYGHTGNTSGYTQFIAASEDGQRSVTVSVGVQTTPNVNEALFPQLREIFELGVCAALKQ
jgi:D-alanyl-D-alanine carboxypeptidase